MSIRSAQAGATGTLVSGPGRLLHVHIVAAGTAGTAEFKNDGAAGASKLLVDTPPAVGPVEVPVPGGGILFSTDIHLTLTTATFVTIIYDDLT
jgi:hypothetical protein